MSIKKRINRILKYSYCFYSRHLTKATDNSGIVLLLFFGRIGDAVMFLDVIKEYKALYIQQRGKKIVLGCRNEAWALFESANVVEGIEFFEVNRENLQTSSSYFRDRVRQANLLNAETVIHVRENHVIEDAFIYSLRIKEKIIYRVYPIEHKGFWAKYFSEHTYTQDLSGLDELDYLTSQADLIRKLGRKEYKSIIPMLPRIDAGNYPTDKPYVCICPGASGPNKCWPTERYAAVVNYIEENSDYLIVMCGGKNEKGIIQAIQERADNKDRILDYSGKSSMDEWISLIQHSAFVVCNESASVHLAACSQVDSVCIGEQKFADKWLPYRPEVLRESDRIPRMIRCETLSCAFCAKKNFKRAPECNRCFQEHGIIKCVYEVSADAVIEAVKLLLQ